MENFTKKYLYAEGAVLILVFLSGLADPSFWLYGLCIAGSIIGLGGLVVSILWTLSCNRAGKSLVAPIGALLANAVLLLMIFLWLQNIFAGGLKFTMMA